MAVLLRSLLSRRKPKRYVDFDALVLFSNAVIAPTAAVAAYAAWMLAWGQQLDGPHFLLGLFIFVAASEVCASHSNRAYAGAEPPAPARRRFGSLVWRWGLAVFVGWAVVELSGMSAWLSHPVLASTALGTPFVLWTAQLVAAPFLYGLDAAAVAPRKAVIVGLTDIGMRWEAAAATDRSLGVQIVGFFDDREGDRLPAVHADKVAGRVSDVPGYVRDHGIGAVYIALPMSREKPIVDLLDGLRDSTVSVYFLPDVFAFDTVQARIECVHGMPLVAICESPFRGPAALAKRVVDVGVSAAALAILGLPMLLIALAVRATSDGPAIFKQRRYGLDGEHILVFKFRTMTVTEDGASSYTQVSRGDARVTAVGRFLRATSLDELPQLVNVLQGSMSIVGPRPHAVAVNEQYRRLIPSYMLRHKVKPGITGLAQVRGFRGGDDLESMTRRIESDLEYLRNWSLALDLRIMWKTAMLVWRDRNAF